MAKIVLQTPFALLILPALWLLVVVFAWRRRFKPFGAFLLRLGIIVLVTLALSRPVIPPPPAAEVAPQEQLVLLIDRSASLSPAMQQAFQTEADRLLAQFPQAITLDFADQPATAPLSAPTAAAPPALNDRSIDPNATNLARALSAGADLLNGRSGRLILFSDGVPTTGDTQAALADLAHQKIPVDVFVPNTAAASGNDIRLVNLTTPPVLRAGQPFDLEVLAHSPAESQANLRITADNVLLHEEAVLLQPGLNRFTLPETAGDPGPHTFKATVTTPEDSQPANNSAAAVSQVYPAPQILLVGDDPAETDAFSGWLKQAGFTIQVMRPADLPTQMSALAPYAGMVILNVPARSLKLEQMLAVQEFVRSLGRGLLVTGGRNSFSLGQYEGTPLADLLPVSLQPPVRSERPPVALLLMIDHSGSMVEERGQLGTRLLLAKEAAIRATNILAPQDTIGVLIFDSTFEWMVPFQKVSDGATLLKIQQDISRITGGSATRVLQALEVGVNEFIAQNPPGAGRHIVLFSDGKSYDQERGLPDYDAIVDKALAADITMSTISIGASTDEALMAHLAERGRGRYHFASSPDELPELTIAESDILRSAAVQEGTYDPAAPAPHPMIRDFLTIASPACQGAACPADPTSLRLPSLSGYIAMTPKPRAEIALQVGPGDPLLGVWGYGLGRVTAWSADTGREWASQWSGWSGASRFWSQIVDYTLPAPNLGLLQVKTDLESTGIVTLSVEGATPTGQTIDLAPPQVTLTTPASREIALALRQVAPGRYQQPLRLADPGAYRVNVTQRPADGGAEQTTSGGFVLPYPAEYALPGEGTGAPLLAQIAATTGGRVFAATAALWPPSSAANEKNKPQEPQELWPWLLLAALVLWPLEIAWRRWGRLRI